MTKKLYVGNLSYDSTEAQIRELFSQVGQVDSVSVITDRETGRSKGFGFVEMNTDEAGQEAIKRFDGYSFNDRSLTVNEAKPREERSGGGSRSGGDGSRRSPTGSYSGNRRRF